MKNIKRLFLKRIFPLFIAIFVFLSVFSISSFASSSYGYYTITNPAIRNMQIYTSDNDGTIGSFLYGGFAYDSSSNSADTYALRWGDSASHNLNGNFFRIEFNLGRFYSYSKGDNVSVSQILSFQINGYDEITDYMASLDILNITFTDRTPNVNTSDGYYLYNNNSFVGAGGKAELNYNITARKDFTFNCFVIYCRVVSRLDSPYALFPVSKVHLDRKLYLNIIQSYSYPDFNVEKDIFSNIKDSYDNSPAGLGVEAYNDYITSFSSNDSIYIAMGKVTAIFHAFFDDGTLFSNILVYSLCIGVIGYVLGVGISKFLYKLSRTYRR